MAFFGLWGGIADSYYRRNTHLLGCGRLGNLADIEGNMASVDKIMSIYGKEKD